MANLHDALKVLHILSFVFMSIPLFNLVVVNERTLMGGGFVYATDRYMENIIRHGATRCFVFQTSVLVTGVLLLLVGPLGIGALWQSWVVLAKTLLLLLLIHGNRSHSRTVRCCVFASKGKRPTPKSHDNAEQG